MSKSSRKRHGKPRRRLADRQQHPAVVAEDGDYVPRRSRPKCAEHPLLAARDARQIDDEQFDAGCRLRHICETLAGSGRDSTNLDRSHGSGGQRTPWTQAQALAAREKGRIRDRLGGARSPNWIICEAFCGYGYRMSEAIRLSGIPCDPHGVIPRVREALDALCGRKPKPLAVTAAAFKKQPPKPWEQKVCAGILAKKTKRGPTVLPCREPLTGKSYPSAVGHWQGKPLRLCEKCAGAETAWVESLGESELFARYRANLWLPAPDQSGATQRAAPQKVAA